MCKIALPLMLLELYRDDPNGSTVVTILSH